MKGRGRTGFLGADKVEAIKGLRVALNCAIWRNEQGGGVS
jgi:hypothetical protein